MRNWSELQGLDDGMTILILLGQFVVSFLQTSLLDYTYYILGFFIDI
ncbi:MAG TPA: hypothetical protein VL943_07305 [Niabella sp.]|nr:hypothetical protein [Niabella sp.]